MGRMLVKSAWGSDDPTKAAFAFLHANALAEAGHEVQIFLLGEAVSVMRTSVVNADHRAHDVPNLFIVDGSNFVTSGRGQPTMTIQALAFRAADRITGLAKAHSI